MYLLGLVEWKEERRGKVGGFWYGNDMESRGDVFLVWCWVYWVGGMKISLIIGCVG